jgi:streptomycin 3"-adenylyltransferase
LVGIYVHGSVAFGCFDWGRSDIDYIAVVNDALPLDVKTALMQKTMQINEAAPPRGLEMSVVLKEHCLNFIYPTPYELHFSNSHREAASGFDKDLAAHFTVIKHTGIVLCGEPIDRVFGDVPREFYFDSIKSDIENARTEIEHNQAYYILNLCRVLAFKQDGLILPKAAGGERALKKIGDKYGGLINAALKDVKADSGLALEFCDYILEKIRS